MRRTVESILEQIVQNVNGDEALLRRGRYVSLTFQLGIDDDDYLLTVVNGRISECRLRTLATETGVFSVRGAFGHW